jgi:type I restriction enzyme R subunit
LASNDSAKELINDTVPKKIAQELAERIRKSATIDWTIKETVRAEMRPMVRRLLRKHKYPPDQQEAATELVLAQAETLAQNLAA